MIKLIEDKFVTNLIGFKSYITSRKILTKKLNNISKPFFLTIKSKKKLTFKKKLKNIKINLVSSLIYFERNYKKELFINVKCREAKNNDIKKIINIAKDNNINSRFIKDDFIPKRFKIKYRSEWVKNFFRKKRGDYLLVAEKDNKILGFILILKKKNIFNIDLVASGKSNRKKKVASSLINFINNKIMKKKDKIVAGTQIDNLIAIKMYKKLGFIKKKSKTFCYHIHGT